MKITLMIRDYTKQQLEAHPTQFLTIEKKENIKFFEQF